jgi:hypothetical protein
LPTSIPAYHLTELVMRCHPRSEELAAFASHSWLSKKKAAALYMLYM